MAMTRGSWIWMSVALIVAILALGWPLIDDKIIVKGRGCPWPFNMLHGFSSWSSEDLQNPAPNAQVDVSTTSTTTETSDAATDLNSYTVEELRKYDGTDKDLPILLAIGGHVLDVTKGAKFYGVGKAYHLFAGRACTRALTLSSLKEEDIHDDTSDFTPQQKQDMQETLQFYLEKYPVVGVLVN